MATSASFHKEWDLSKQPVDLQAGNIQSRVLRSWDRRPTPAFPRAIGKRSRLVWRRYALLDQPSKETPRDTLEVEITKEKKGRAVKRRILDMSKMANPEDARGQNFISTSWDETTEPGRRKISRHVETEDEEDAKVDPDTSLVDLEGENSDSMIAEESMVDSETTANEIITINSPEILMSDAMDKPEAPQEEEQQVLPVDQPLEEAKMEKFAEDVAVSVNEMSSPTEDRSSDQGGEVVLETIEELPAAALSGQHVASPLHRPQLSRRITRSQSRSPVKAKMLSPRRSTLSRSSSPMKSLSFTSNSPTADPELNDIASPEATIDEIASQERERDTTKAEDEQETGETSEDMTPEASESELKESTPNNSENASSAVVSLEMEVGLEIGKEIGHEKLTSLISATKEEATGSGPTSSNHHLDDTSLLHAFLDRCQASKKARNMARRDSDIVRRALASPPVSPPASARTPLGELQTNSPLASPYKQTMSEKGNGDAIPAATPRKKKSGSSKPLQSTPQNTETAITSATSSCRRSARTRLPVPQPKGATPAEKTKPKTNISVRGAEGLVPQLLQKNAALELAQTTRSNTRRNKGQAIPALQWLAQQEKAAAEGKTIEEAPESVMAEVEKIKTGVVKEVKWDAQLVYFKEWAEADVKEKSEKEKTPAKPKAKRVKLGAGNGTPAAKRVKDVESKTLPAGTPVPKRVRKVKV